MASRGTRTDDGDTPSGNSKQRRTQIRQEKRQQEAARKGVPPASATVAGSINYSEPPIVKKARRLDYTLAFLGAGMTVLTILLPPATNIRAVFYLAALFIFFAYPSLHLAEWILRSSRLVAKSSGIAALAAVVILLGIYVWPKPEKPPLTKAEVKEAVSEAISDLHLPSTLEKHGIDDSVSATVTRAKPTPRPAAPQKTNDECSPGTAVCFIGNVHDNTFVGGYLDGLEMKNGPTNNKFIGTTIAPSRMTTEDKFRQFKEKLRSHAGSPDDLGRDFDWFKTQLMPRWNDLNPQDKQHELDNFDYAKNKVVAVGADKADTLKLIDKMYLGPIK